MNQSDFPEENDDTNGTNMPPVDGLDHERMWSVTVHLEPCPDGIDIGEYCTALRTRIGGFLHDLGHVEWYGLSLQLRIECTTTSLQRLFKKKLWRQLHIRDVQIADLEETVEVGGEG